MAKCHENRRRRLRRHKKEVRRCCKKILTSQLLSGLLDVNIASTVFQEGLDRVNKALKAFPKRVRTDIDWWSHSIVMIPGARFVEIGHESLGSMLPEISEKKGESDTQTPG